MWANFWKMIRVCQEKKVIEGHSRPGVHYLERPNIACFRNLNSVIGSQVRCKGIMGDKRDVCVAARSW